MNNIILNIIIYVNKKKTLLLKKRREVKSKAGSKTSNSPKVILTESDME